MTLAEYLKDKKPGKFRPFPMYSVAGDFLWVYFENAPAYTEGLDVTVPDADRRLEVARAFDDNRIVGLKIWGVGKLVDEKRAEPPGELLFIGDGIAPPR